MYDVLGNILKQAIDKNNGELRSNPAAHNLYNLLKDRNFQSARLENLTLFTQLIKQADKSDEKSSRTRQQSEVEIPSIIIDKRVIALRVAGVKKFPAQHNLFYGLDFDRSAKPYSTVFLGKNGIGKTSLFASLEYFLLGKAYTAELKKLSTDNFLTNIKTPKDKVRIRLLSVGKNSYVEKKLSDSPQRETVPAFFCSEWDVKEIECTKNLTPYIIEQLGLGPYENLLGMLRTAATEEASLFDPSSKIINDIINLQISSVIPKSFILNTTDPFLPAEFFLLMRTVLIGNTLANVPNPGDKESVDRFINNLKSNISGIKSEQKIMFLDVQNASINMYSEILDTAEKITNLCTTDSYEIKDSIDPKLLEAYISHYNGCYTILVERRLKIIDNYHKIEDSDIEQIRKELEDDKRRIKTWDAELNRAISNNPKSHNEDGSNPETALTYKKIYFNHLEWSIYFPPLFEFLSQQLSGFLFEKVIAPLKNVFSELLNPYLEEDDAEVVVNYSDNNLQINLRLKEDNSVDPFSPHRYLNTFRFKLFAVALKISLACTAKLIYKENWPIIIDDVFDSSDFNNRIHINRFIQQIVTKYNKLLNDTEERTNQYPFQIIFFTQDDVIGSAVFEGLKKSKEPSRLCRIHHLGSFSLKEWKKEVIDESVILQNLVIADELEYHDPYSHNH